MFLATLGNNASKNDRITDFLWVTNIFSKEWSPWYEALSYTEADFIWASSNLQSVRKLSTNHYSNYFSENLKCTRNLVFEELVRFLLYSISRWSLELSREYYEESCIHEWLYLFFKNLSFSIVFFFF